MRHHPAARVNEEHHPVAIAIREGWNMTNGSILVVDDELEICSLIQEILEDEGYQVKIAENAEQARSAKVEFKPDLILLDIWMPDTDGITLLKEWYQAGPALPLVIMMSGHGTVETAVEATRLGAYDYLEKPLSLAKLLLTIKHALDANTLQRENLRLKQFSVRSADIVGKSRTIRALKEQLQRVAGHKTPILIIGEAGTDKEAVARYLHNLSPQRDGPFVSVGIAALTASGSAVELFGKEAGGNAYPGALEKAAGGTLFLKDIADMDLNTQARLQSALEKNSFTRIGGLHPVKLDIRLIAATRSLLEDKVREGAFRNDLFFQLNVVPVRIPPIREHYEDIPELLEYYVNYFVEQEGLSYKHFTTAAQNRLRRYSWPGNLRELKNLVQRLLILGSSEVIDLKEVETALGEQRDDETAENLYNFDIPLRQARERFEKAYLEHQLKQHHGSVSKIAKIVGMERTHLYRKLKSLNIDIKG
jgi:DNA-binding NtrC family response regulator